MLETIIEHNDSSKAQLLKEKLWQVVNTIAAETEKEEQDAKRNDNNVTTDTFIHSPVTTNISR